MIEHISNCHGEWNALYALLVSTPILGVWVRYIHMRWKGDCKDEKG